MIIRWECFWLLRLLIFVAYFSVTIMMMIMRTGNRIGITWKRRRNCLLNTVALLIYKGKKKAKKRKGKERKWEKFRLIDWSAWSRFERKEQTRRLSKREVWTIKSEIRKYLWFLLIKQSKASKARNRKSQKVLGWNCEMQIIRSD